jgi:hypothetical protein
MQKKIKLNKLIKKVFIFLIIMFIFAIVVQCTLNYIIKPEDILQMSETIKKELYLAIPELKNMPVTFLQSNSSWSQNRYSGEVVDSGRFCYKIGAGDKSYSYYITWECSNNDKLQILSIERINTVKE